MHLLTFFDIFCYFLYYERMTNEKTGLSENKMGVMPVTKLLVNMSLPMMFSMLIQALYNIVDSIFVAKISENALTAVSMAFPIQTLMMAFALGTSVGVNALLSMRLGQKNQEGVNKTAVNGLFLAICSYIVFLVVGLACTGIYFSTQTSDREIIDLGISYTSIVIAMSFGMYLGIMFDKLLQSTGLTFYTMITQIVGAVFNLIFDPLLIFGLGPFPKMGIAGAALATVLGQIFACVLSYLFNIRVNKEIQFKFKGFVPDKNVIAHIYKIAVPSILMQSINSITTYGMNLIIGKFSMTAVAVYGVYFKLNSFIFLPVFGLNTGMVPIISFNYGACNKKRITKTIKVSLIFALSIMAFGVVIFETIPAKLLALFNASPEMLAIGVPALRIIAPSFMGAAIAIVMGSTFQALGNAVYSMNVSFVRQIVVLLPVAYMFSLSGKVNNVWFCFLVAEIFAISLSFFYLHRIYIKKIKPLDALKADK